MSPVWHLVVAVIAFAVLFCYIFRAVRNIAQWGWGDVLVRLGLGLVLLSIANGGLDLWRAHAPFVSRHVFVLVALTVSLIGYGVMRWETHRRG